MLPRWGRYILGEEKICCFSPHLQVGGGWRRLGADSGWAHVDRGEKGGDTVRLIFPLVQPPPWGLPGPMYLIDDFADLPKLPPPWTSPMLEYVKNLKQIMKVFVKIFWVFSQTSNFSPIDFFRWRGGSPVITLEYILHFFSVHCSPPASTRHPLTNPARRRKRRPAEGTVVLAVVASSLSPCSSSPSILSSSHMMSSIPALHRQPRALRKKCESILWVSCGKLFTVQQFRQKKQTHGFSLGEICWDFEAKWEGCNYLGGSCKK